MRYFNEITFDDSQIMNTILIFHRILHLKKKQNSYIHLKMKIQYFSQFVTWVRPMIIQDMSRDLSISQSARLIQSVPSMALSQVWCAYPSLSKKFLPNTH